MKLPELIYNKSPIFFQAFLLNAKALELYLERYGKKFWNLFNEFDKNQWLSESELEEYQNEKLRLLIKHAYDTVPYYKKLMYDLKLNPDDIKTKADLFKLPVLKKEHIRSNFNLLISSKFRKYRLRHGHTSGTTGSPLDVCYDINTCVVHHVADWRQKIWAGMKYGDSYASLLGRVIVPINQNKPPFWRKNYINNQLILSSFHLKDQNLPYYFDKMAKDNIRFIEGYPSTIYILAMYLNKNSIHTPLEAVLTSSETLFDFQREAIEKAFQCKIFDYYGMAERAVFASECAEHKGHHLNSDYGITEFLNGDNQSVTPVKMGKIVATNLHNFAMPLIRYQTNDSSSLKKENCSCGRTFPLMDDVATKNESILTLPDGRLISPSVLTHPFKPMNNIVESQIIQEKLDFLVIKVVRDKKYSRKDEEKLISAFHDRLGSQIKIKVDYVDSIPRTKTGKLKWVISRIKAEI